MANPADVRAGFTSWIHTVCIGQSSCWSLQSISTSVPGRPNSLSTTSSTTGNWFSAENHFTPGLCRLFTERNRPAPATLPWPIEIRICSCTVYTQSRRNQTYPVPLRKPSRARTNTSLLSKRPHVTASLYTYRYCTYKSGTTLAETPSSDRPRGEMPLLMFPCRKRNNLASSLVDGRGLLYLLHSIFTWPRTCMWSD